jgi:hypothetical protein
MKSNLRSLPCFTKTITLDSQEYKMMHKVLASVLVAYGKEMSLDDAKTISNIVDKLTAPSHNQNN